MTPLRLAPFIAALMLAAACAPTARAGTLSTQAEALERAFPGATVERHSFVLTEAQMARAGELAGEKMPSALVVAYEARRDGRPVGTAYFDVHRVRTLQQTVMVVVDADGRLVSVDILAFFEPPEYLAPERWLQQFKNRALDENLQIRRDIQGITGATLTARATTKAARRVLALHRVLKE